MAKTENTAEVEHVTDRDGTIVQNPDWNAPARESLAAPTSFAAAMEETGLAAEDTIVILDANETLNQEKDALIGVPFLIRQVVFSTTDDGGEYANIWLVTRDDKQYRITDGSTGIYRQLEALTNRLERDGGFYIGRGLRKSEYKVEIDGRKQDAVTYYLDA